MKAPIEGVDYVFHTPGLLDQALTHPSILSPGEGRAFERLEFLGDRVLGLIVAEWLFEVFPHDAEGDLAKRFANLVRKETLVEVALSLSLDRSLRMRREKSFSQEKRLETLLADACEALIGALYLDGGLEAARPFIHKNWEPYLHITQTPPRDPKSILQEWIQGKGKPHPAYKVLSTEGPAHAPLFVVEVFVEGYDPTQGEGSSKQLAEKAAAENLLQKLKRL